MKPIKIQCSRCRGKGTVPLTGVYAKTMNVLKALGKPMNGAQIGRLMGCKETAMNQRLIRLQGLGLAYGEWNGRERLWRAQ